MDRVFVCLPVYGRADWILVCVTILVVIVVAVIVWSVLQPDPNSDAAYIADDMNEPVVPDTSVQFTSRDDLRTPNPSTGICSIWVGNVNHDVLSQAAIRGLFAK